LSGSSFYFIFRHRGGVQLGYYYSYYYTQLLARKRAELLYKCPFCCLCAVCRLIICILGMTVTAGERRVKDVSKREIFSSSSTHQIIGQYTQREREKYSGLTIGHTVGVLLLSCVLIRWWITLTLFFVCVLPISRRVDLEIVMSLIGFGSRADVCVHLASNFFDSLKRPVLHIEKKKLL
jgi:hypothetical protein